VTASFTVEPTGQSCGALVHGIDLRRLDDATAAALREVWLEHQVIAFPDQDLSIEQLEAVARHFGPFGEDPYLPAMPDHPHVVELKREADETSPIFAEAWHSDWSFLPTPPAGTLLYGVEIPPVGGDTLYSNQYAAYDALDDDMKQRIADLDGIHSARRGYAKDGQYGDKDTDRSMPIRSSDDAMATQPHPLVRTHPETGRKALFCSIGYTIDIEGLDHDDAQTLLWELYRHVGREDLIYRHQWSTGMLTLWDNRAVLHQATGGYDGHRRVLHRITIGEREGT
jgi:taurine dioxygenase